MIRRALIIYCDDTSSGALNGPSKDNEIYRDFLQNNLGGSWYEPEVESLHNPTALEVERMKLRFLNGADYTFIIFTGHGYIDVNNRKQYVELDDVSIPIIDLKTTAKRQTLIVDACRGYYQPLFESFEKAVTFSYAIGGIIERSTRLLFEQAIMQAEMGWTILFAASENQSATDTDNGGAYLYSLYKVAKMWEDSDTKYKFLCLDVVHQWAVDYMNENIETAQEPTMNQEKRRNYFPFAVKYV